MADLSSLGNLTPAQPLDMDLYPQAQEFRLPEKGRYTLRAPDSFDAKTFGASAAGYLTAQVDPTIVGPTNEGFQVRRTRLSAKTWENKGQPVSQIGNYLRACGFQGQVSGDPQELANAVESTAGRVYEAILDWRASHFGSGFEVKGMDKFPIDPKTGNRQSWVEHPTEKDPDGKPLRLRANVEIVRFIAA